MIDLVFSPVVAGTVFALCAVAPLTFALEFADGSSGEVVPDWLAVCRVVSFLAMIAACGWLWSTNATDATLRRAAARGVPVAAIVERCDRLEPLGSLDDCLKAGIRRYELRSEIADALN